MAYDHRRADLRLRSPLLRYHLDYHTVPQILGGLGIGIAFGAVWYMFVELIPLKFPGSPLGRLRLALLESVLGQWMRVRDGWATYADGGHEEEWRRWRVEWDRQRRKIKQ